jgi:hypothetical protein
METETGALRENRVGVDPVLALYGHSSRHASQLPVLAGTCSASPSRGLADGKAI